jgi:hypothetical protein
MISGKSRPASKLSAVGVASWVRALAAPPQTNVPAMMNAVILAHMASSVHLDESATAIRFLPSDS